ncbi:DNA adenine methylase [Photobacterium kishitanii]|uniref:site-specific DNA-methyltransferase (adenine-specific) n=1 Tax=Photobacterium kishitanii TaxID=318456 RepID=A0A2T3KMA0_9GAMM|nr:Dam family site-specific DNA-(adenine-N6)-methyltransferase [Photobacterium kishitanii]PSV00875.1 hypothetical protein C9J27_02280 [Photobacterium kishitanii]
MLPILRWAGGKSFVTNNIDQLLKSTGHNGVDEFFAGAGAISFHLEKEGSILNDINPHLINLYKQIQSGAIKSISDCINIENTKENFLKNRERFNFLIKNNDYLNEEAAALFYYINRTCFNGLCRFNKKGLYNVGWGQLKKPIIKNSFDGERELFEKFIFTNLSYNSASMKNKHVKIIDPPYFDVFVGYTSKGFTLQDQVATSELNLNESPALAFNSSHPKMLELYAENGWSVFTIKAPRRISCNGDRKKAIEMLAVKMFSDKEILHAFKNKEVVKIY